MRNLVEIQQGDAVSRCSIDIKGASDNGKACEIYTQFRGGDLVEPMTYADVCKSENINHAAEIKI